LLSSSMLDDIFFPFSAQDAWRTFIPRARWEVSTQGWHEKHYSLHHLDSTLIQYAPLLAEMETVFKVKVRHVVAVISEYTHFSDRPNSNLVHLGRHQWARFMTGQVSSILNCCSGLKTMDVQLKVKLGQRPEGNTIHLTFDRFYNSTSLRELWDVLAGQYGSAKLPVSSFDELHIRWKKTCQSRGVALKFLAEQMIPMWPQNVSSTEQHRIQPRRFQVWMVYEEDMTDFWDIPKCMKSKANNPDVDIGQAGLEWAIERQIARRTGKQLPKKRTHEARMGADCEC